MYKLNDKFMDKVNKGEVFKIISVKEIKDDDITYNIKYAGFSKIYNIRDKYIEDSCIKISDEYYSNIFSQERKYVIGDKFKVNDTDEIIEITGIVQNVPNKSKYYDILLDGMIHGYGTNDSFLDNNCTKM